jgi:prepilin-type processing-associated H-X9-DG protein
MPQAWLPLIPSGSTEINDVVSVVRADGQWTYFCGIHPVFFHAQDDRKAFRMFTAQLVCQGMSKQAEIVKTFGVSKNSVKRAAKKYRRDGAEGFFAPRKTRRGGSVLTQQLIDQAQQMLAAGDDRGQVAQQLGIKPDTLRKAINQGRVIEPPKIFSKIASDKSQRSVEDASASMGVACTRADERVFAALRLLDGASTIFEPCRDVSFGGVLCALPALTVNGLYDHLEQLDTLHGYYTVTQVVTLLAYMALCGIRTVEQLQYQPPGELGKLMGLDRVPEVRCLRNKLKQLSDGQRPQKWAALLSRDWMQKNPELAGVLYVDGHVRLYHGKLTELPKRYVSRQRLCLRGTTDYWVNDALGQPFFVVNRPVDQGMLEALRTEIVPRLIKEVPGQPSQQQLEQNLLLARFILVFDREGYSPAFFQQMWQQYRISCITYHKFPKDQWPLDWFADTPVSMPDGQILNMKLAEHGSLIGEHKTGVWVREVRKLNQDGHQTSLISTGYSRLAVQDAAQIFSRWAQENFFGYMMKHYAIDLLCEYGTERFPGPQQVVNPRWRELDRQHRALKSKLTYRQSRYGSMQLEDEGNQSQLARWTRKKSELVEQIEQLEHELQEVKTALTQTNKHIDWSELADEDKFERLVPSRKSLMDTVKLIAYRSETSMVNIVREKLARTDDARAVIRDLCRSEADLLPDTEANILHVRVHSMANPRLNAAIEHLLTELNASELNYPGTNLRLTYSLNTGGP